MDKLAGRHVQIVEININSHAEIIAISDAQIVILVGQYDRHSTTDGCKNFVTIFAM